ncbi:hypothetical protein RJ640_028118 [Escallonia rubra]|uniref:Phytocyanin domain-containing protein n=1 Tax=Escallonia rubra TaxID=112253 RepID=A0AA88S6D0_9ASTE|nr:hypothetical protein RJ640_028118 [Escallonia rubra]
MEGAYKYLLALFLAALITKEASATRYPVGGSQGWDESTDFKSWASGQTFKVGDELVFKYNSGLHSVVELGSESAYKNCDIGTAVNSMNGGKDVVKLTKPGTRYFACGTMGHCGQGMKVKIKTVAADASSTSGSSPSSSTSSTSTSAASAFQPISSLIAMTASAAFLFAFDRLMNA